MTLLAALLAPGRRAEPLVDRRLRRILSIELLIVLSLSLFRNAISSLLDIINDLAMPAPLASQSASLNSSTYDNSLVDLGYQLLVNGIRLTPVLLVLYLLARSSERPSDIGLSGAGKVLDLLRGVGIAAVVGGTGLALYLGAHAAGLSVTVIPTSLGPTWWRDPVLVLSAATNAVLEEVVVLGYLVRRLDQRGWSDARVTASSALVRGSYHLYQGFGGFVGNAVMGTLFVRLYRRWGRIVPMAIAHTLIDTVAFLGYVLLAGHVSWLPT